MAITILPRDYNPWVQQLPSMLQSMAVQSLAQRFKTRERKASQTFETEQAASERAKDEAFTLKTDFIETPHERVPAGSDAVYHNNKWYLPRKKTSRDIIDQYEYAKKNDGYTGTLADWKKTSADKPKITTLKGEKFYWENRGGKWYQTKIPVPEKSGGITFNAPGVPAQTGGQQPAGNLKDAALEGTGVWANMGAAIDAVAGGLGIDALVGKDGFFKDTQDARHQLRVVKQLGKSALMNSSRGAIWEQQKIDKLFPDPDSMFKNPRTEARKLASLREILTTERQYNYQAMKQTQDPVRFRTLQESNANIERLLAQFGTDESSATSTDDDALIQKYLQGTP